MSHHLPAKHQQRLVKQAQSGDEAARHRLIETNQSLIAHWARRYTGRGLEFEDLLQEGQVGMLRAIDRYQVGHGTSFATYASFWIRQALGRACEKQGSVQHFGMRLPSAVYHARNRIDSAEQDFAVQQARRLQQQGAVLRYASLESALGERRAAPDPCELLPVLLGQCCGHLQPGWRPGRYLHEQATQLADRAWAGSLSPNCCWLISRLPKGAWELELFAAGRWQRPAEAVPHLADHEREALLALLDGLGLQAAESCPSCVG